MKRANRRHQGKAAIDLIEEATHLLRTVPAAVLASYYVGSLPFVLGLLYFWADMSRDPFAYQRLAPAALGMALLFLWLKCWQGVFARRLRAVVLAEPASGWNFQRARRLFLAQAVLQPTGLFVAPLALVPVLPFAWGYAFYQNLTALDDGETDQIRALGRKAWQQTVLWPRQNHMALCILFAFGLCVFLNWSIFCYALPHLAKMLFGIESVVTRSGLSLLNTTYFSFMLGLTYLTVDPIAKAVYVLRCFYGESLESGEDLKAELKHLALQAKPLALAIVFALSLAGATTLRAAEASPEAAPAQPVHTVPVSIAPADLDRAINEVIQESKYTWRMPREKVVTPDAKEGVIARFLDRAGQWVRARLRDAAEWLGERLRKLFGRSRPPGGSGSGNGWMFMLHLLLYTLLAAVGVALTLLLYRFLRNRRRRPVALQSQPIQPMPDLADENVGPDQLPEDGWIKLARELWARGELRLALRAFYLASLAHLAQRNLISLARFKSNRDYEHELNRRAHSIPELRSVFAENVSVFDRIWYGLHEVNDSLVNEFAANVERIKTAE